MIGIHIPEFRRIHTDEAVSIYCPEEDSDQGNRKHFIRKGLLDACLYKFIRLPHIYSDQRNKRGS